MPIANMTFCPSPTPFLLFTDRIFVALSVAVTVATAFAAAHVRGDGELSASEFGSR